MSSYNLVVLMGNLTHDPELRFLSDKRALCEVGIAVNNRYKKKNSEELVERVDFFDVTFWGRTAEVVNEFLTKGSLIQVQGRLKQDRWEKDGEKRTKVKVICDAMQMIGSKTKSDV